MFTYFFPSEPLVNFCNSVAKPYYTLLVLNWRNYVVNCLSGLKFRKMWTLPRQRLSLKNSRWMDDILEMSGNFSYCWPIWITHGGILAYALNSRFVGVYL